ncbi:hypothetical protein KGY79_10900 [Candidatus Bipolaricaulota bacterium]|nr:hypothetical protein [Candidatus Bipolaricaulota bacterium]
MRRVAGIFSARSPRQRKANILNALLQVLWLLFRKILSEAEWAWFHAFSESMGSEAEIGSSDFHAGEIACGFIEQLPENGFSYSQYTI